MAKNIEDNDNAREFWENLADASALSEETKTALRAKIAAAAAAHSHSGADPDQWLEGSMHAAMTASLGGNIDWLFVPENDANRVILAIDTILGTGWHTGGGGGSDPLTTVSYWYRPYWQNKSYMDNSPNISFGFMSTAEATLTSGTGANEGIPDGFIWADFSYAVIPLGSNYATYPLPATLQTMVWNGGGLSFSYIFDALALCPWHPYLGGKIIDCGGGTYSTDNYFILSDAQQSVLEAFMDAGNAVVLPASNALNAAWTLVPTYPSYLTAQNTVTYDTVLITRGDGVSDGLTDTELVYVLPPSWESTNEASPVSISAVFPRRTDDHPYFYGVTDGGSPQEFYVAPKQDYTIF